MTTDQNYVRSLFLYHDGQLLWKPRTDDTFQRPCDAARYRNNFANRNAGYEDWRGYRQLNLPDGTRTLAHRIVWIWHNGPISNGLTIDHIDGDTRNNRIKNLRAVPHSENMKNRAKGRTNTSGITNVQWLPERGKWRARGFIGGSKHLGYFAEKDDAVKAIRAYYQANGCTDRHGL
jgi:hypothetical protein